MSDYCFSPTEIGSEKEERKSAEKPIIIHIDKSNKLCDKLMKPIQVSAKNDFSFDLHSIIYSKSNGLI